jgi:hypothetical protein
MSLSLTCACGARFELDDTFAGQEVHCPDCQQKLQAPGLSGPAAARRTSDWALASMVLALLGAFTVIGTVIAVLCGVVALVLIGRYRDRVSGAGFAMFGIIAGLVFTTLTVFALASGDLFGLGAMMRERNFADQIDRSGPDEVLRPNQGFAMTRPSRKWGVAIGNTVEDPFFAILQGGQGPPDLLLVQPTIYAFVDVHRFSGQVRSLTQLKDYVEDDLLRAAGGRRNEPFRIDKVEVTQSRELPGDVGQAREVEVDVKCGGQSWKMIVRHYQIDAGRAFLVRAYTQKRFFEKNKAELLKALDSFHVLP